MPAPKTIASVRAMSVLAENSSMLNLHIASAIDEAKHG
jgi:hypothetical protein